MLGSTGLFLLCKKDRYFALRALLTQREVPSTPQSLRDSPLGGTGKGFPDTPSVASLRVRCSRSAKYLQPPSHFVTAPWGARGKDSPIPLLSLRSACAYLQIPSHFVTAPLGGTGDRIPQTPCVASHCVRIPSTPQSLRDGPLGGTGDRIPQTPCVASLRGVLGALGALGVAFMGGMVGKKTTVCGFCRSLCSLGSCGGTGCLCREGKR